MRLKNRMVLANRWPLIDAPPIGRDVVGHDAGEVGSWSSGFRLSSENRHCNHLVFDRSRTPWKCAKLRRRFGQTCPGADHTMRYEAFDVRLFQTNRERLRAQLLPSSLAIVNANDLQPTTTDGSMPYYPNSDLFYFTGIEQEETVLFVAPDAHDETLREVLFL